MDVGLSWRMGLALLLPSKCMTLRMIDRVVMVDRTTASIAAAGEHGVDWGRCSTAPFLRPPSWVADCTGPCAGNPVISQRLAGKEWTARVSATRLFAPAYPRVDESLRTELRAAFLQARLVARR